MKKEKNHKTKLKYKFIFLFLSRNKINLYMRIGPILNSHIYIN